MTTPWTPRRANPQDHHVLVDGVPDWMDDSIRVWLMQFLYPENKITGLHYYNVLLTMRYDLDNRMTTTAILTENGPETLYQLMDNDQRLDFIDWLVSRAPAVGVTKQIKELEAILARGGSKWKVGTRNGYPGLEERVPEGVQSASEWVMSTPGDAGQLLKEAWAHTFGRSGDPQSAYNEAVKAVEAAACPIVEPKNGSATLGTVIKVMEAQGDWKLDMSRVTTMQTVSDATVLGMMKTLWQGQQRHAGQPGHIPNTQPDAEAAIMLAVPLVQWFSSSALARRP